MKNHKLETNAGDRFKDVAKRAKEIACSNKIIVEFSFNGVKCLVDEWTYLGGLERDYGNAHIMDWKKIGHYCAFQYDCDTEIELRKRQLKQAIARKKEFDEREKKEANAKKNFAKSIKGVVSDVIPSKKKKYTVYVKKNSTEGYSRAVIDYAEAWAKLMQKEIKKGKAVKDCADYTQEGLGFMGVTGFQYGCVVSALAEFWKHGEDLRKWHNKEYGIEEKDDKGGVVNPAVLTITK